MKAPYLVSTDLDGTLLDHDDYSWDAAKPALDYCAELGVPVILNTSKTAAESRSIQAELGLNAPMIVENGSALLFDPNLWQFAEIDEIARFQQEGSHGLLFGRHRADLLAFLNECRRHSNWKFEGFSDWSVSEICKHTGLNKSAAKQAAEKQFSEPFIWKDSEENFSLFSKAVKDTGFRLTKGGRFHHLQGQCDKSIPLTWLRSTLRLDSEEREKDSAVLICLGDGQNDVEMLNVADFPVCVRSPSHEFPELTTAADIFYTQAMGPAGWNEAITQILGQNIHG